MSGPGELLPSWRPGRTRDDVVAFLTAAPSVPVVERLACFDNDGTLWCERPGYVQFAFFVDALRRQVEVDPSVARRAEFAAVLGGDPAAMGTLGLERIALALAELFEGLTPEQFTERARAYMSAAVHPTFGRPLRTLVYQPMLELIGALHRLEFTVAVVTGGGTEFVRAISRDLYGVPAEAVVGTLIDYEFRRDGTGRPVLLRSARVLGQANEGAPKVANIQTQLGRRPILAAGNSGGDREMLEWACAGEHPGLALLVEHDDDEREFSYASTAQTFAEPEPITDVAARLGWTTVSIARDWKTVFPPEH